ncbi:hypothetical protein TYRP_013727 [Tyrophagus putrescentiae]|nr:hypothetical protein TYRP_013727 [Tyrophagus putrescentiae]
MPRVTTLNTTTTTVEPSDNDRSTDRASEWTRLGEIGHDFHFKHWIWIPLTLRFVMVPPTIVALFSESDRI